MSCESEQIRARRSALKWEFDILYDQVAEILFQIDPAGINFDDNTDEYHPETDTILPRLATCASESDVRGVVEEEFTRWFDGEFVSGIEDKNKFDQIAVEVWDAFQIFQGRNLLMDSNEQNNSGRPD